MRSSAGLLIVLLMFPVWMRAASKPAAMPDQAHSQLDGLPLVFEPNLGQANPSVKFLSHGQSYNVLLDSDGMTLTLPGDRSSASSKQAIDIRLTGATQAKAEGRDLLSGVSNYFVGKNSVNWLTGVPQYAKVAYASVYRGVDLVYYGSHGELEYDFVVHPGADASLLGFRIAGSSKLEVTPSGDLSLRLGNGTVELKQPIVYQVDDQGRHEPIAGKYVLRAKDEVGLVLGGYDHARPLVVDPVLSYSTLIGGNNNTQIQGVAVDGAGRVIVTGTTSATDFPVVHGAQPQSGGYDDVFVTKLSASGSSIVYSTYLGGGVFDSGRAIAIDWHGNAYVTGNAGSSDFPTTSGAFMQDCVGICNTPFVAKLLEDGKLAYSTLMGGSNMAAWAIAVDHDGSAYITGAAASNDLPLVNAFQSTVGGAFVEKLNPQGSGLEYSTYLGGGSDWGRGIAVDAAQSAYVVGSTSSSFPLKNPLQSSIVGGPNAFITKFSPDGSTLVFSTYLGGSSPYFFGSAGDFATGVAVDHSGNVHVTGTTSSCEFPLSIDAFSTNCVGTDYDQKQFVLALNSSGTQILFSTLLRSGFAGGIAVDKDGNSYVAGTTSAYDLPLLNPIQNSSQQSNSVGFVTEFSPKGKILFSTYLGSTSGGGAPAGIAVDADTNIYVAGAAQGDFPLLNPIPSQTPQQTFYQQFIAKISPKKSPALSLSPRTTGSVSLRNMSNATLTISSITTSFNLAQTGDCGASLAPATGCSLMVQSLDNPAKPGTITVASNASPATQTFTIFPGYSFTPPISVFPTYIQFPAQLSGTASLKQRVIIKNSGPDAVPISNIAVIQHVVFSETNDCPALLSKGSFCTISLKYTPTAPQQDYDQLSITHDSAGSQETVYLSGTGVSSSILASIPQVDFGTEFVGMAPLNRIVNLTNTSPVTGNVNGITTSTGFSQINTCTGPLAPQASCRVAVAFAPKTNEISTGTLKVGSFGPGGTQTVNLYGNGLLLSDLTVSPIPLNLYGSAGHNAGTGDVLVTNISAKTVTLQTPAIAAPFTSKRNCTASLAPGATCTITVTFTPTKEGVVQATLSIPHTGTGSPQVVPIVGTGQSLLLVQPSPLDFGQQPVGQSLLGYAGIGNNSPLTVKESGLTVQGSDFVLSKNGCPTVFQPFIGCGDVEISFKPTHTGLRTGTLTVVADDATQPHVIRLQGVGVSGGKAILAPASLTFATRAVGTQSTSKTVKLTNNGTGTLAIASIVTTPAFFAETSNCGATLAKGASCTISVIFAPTQQGMLQGTIVVSDDGAGSPHSVGLSGIAQ